jgi:2-methylcitrate dehydratase PrpD
MSRPPSRRSVLAATGLASGALLGSGRGTAVAGATPLENGHGPFVSPASGCSDEGSGETVSQAWGHAVAEAEFSDLGPDVVERAKWCLLDCLAVMAYGARQPEVDVYLGRAIACGGLQEARIMPTGHALPMQEAAACNAFLIHAKEIDDNDFRGGYRPSCVAVAPALAVADWQRSSGRDLLLATSIAYTLTGRLAAMAPNMQNYGFMPSAIFGAVGGAAAASRLMKLDADQTASAIGLATAAGGGLFQYYFDQTEDKKLHVARTSRTSVEMAIQASRGFVGPHRAIEGVSGLNAYLQGGTTRFSAGPLVADLANWEGPLHITPKFFAVSASIGPFLDAFDPVWRASGATAADIDHFRIVREWAPESVAGQKILSFQRPATITGAQLDMAFSIALYLVTGDAGPDSFTEARLAEPSILALADRAALRQVDVAAPFSLEVSLKDGRMVSAPFAYPRGGGRAQPLMREARLQKIERLTQGVLTDPGRRQLFDTVMALDQVQDSHAWMTDVNGLLMLGRSAPH